MKHWLPYCRPDNTVKGNSNSLLDHSTKAISFIHTGECSKLITPPRSELFCFHTDREGFPQGLHWLGDHISSCP